MLQWLNYKKVPAELAHELVQQASLRALENLDHLRDPQKLKAWFRQILRNTWMDEYKRQARLFDFEQVPEPMDAEPFSSEESCDCVLTLLQQIQPQYAQLLAAIDIEERSVQEVAQQLGIQPNNASVRLYRARKALAKQLKQVCGTDSVRTCLNCSCT